MVNRLQPSQFLEVHILNSMLEGNSFDGVSELAVDCLQMSASTELSDVFIKSPNDFVTNLDFRLESFLKGRLPQLVDLPVLSEEDETKFDGTERSYWMVDPLDGTNNFRLGLRDVATSVALVIDNKVEYGLLISHDRKAMFSAQRGIGLKRVDFDRAQHSQSNERSTNLVGLSSGFLRWSMNQEGELRQAWQNLSAESNFRNLGSQVMHAWHVAAGTFLASFSAESHVWDDLAARLVVEEAGGSWISINSLLDDAREQRTPSSTSTCFFGGRHVDYLAKFQALLARDVEKQGEN